MLRALRLLLDQGDLVRQCGNGIGDAGCLPGDCEGPSMDGDVVDPTLALSHRVTGVPGLPTQEEIKMMDLGRGYLSSAITVTTGLPAT